MGEGESHPEVIPGGEDLCLVCGHCVAVCPHHALDHSQIPGEGCVPIKKEYELNEEQAVQFLRSRRSIRLYKDTPVEKDKIRGLIEIARYAPTSGNQQLVEWTVFTDKKQIKEIAGFTVDWMRKVLEGDPEPALNPYLPRLLAAWDEGHDLVLREAPALLVTSAPEEALNGLVDLTLSLSYLELAALTMGLGTCWAGMVYRALLHWPPLKEAIQLPEGHTIFYPMMLGYPQVKYHRLPERKPPKITWK
jgi:nitroreductase